MKNTFARRRRDIFSIAQRAHGVDAVHIVGESDIRYLTGLVEGSRHVLFGADWCVLYTYRMYRDRAPREAPGAEVILADKPLDEIPGLLAGRGVRKLGVQEKLITLDVHNRLTNSADGIVTCGVSEAVAQVRQVKDEQEITALARATAIAERTFLEMKEAGAAYFIGKTERQIAADLSYRMRMNGADGDSFPKGLIVASGPNSAGCHHQPTDRRIADGEPLLIDWGALLDGYHNDQTRVLFMGSVPERLAVVYDVVLAAYRAAEEAARPGITGKELDAVARDSITAAGHGEAFRHGLGHGVGLDIHEPPLLRQTEDALAEGMVITLEPGVYYEGVGGVRLENMVRITANGCAPISTLPLDLDTMVVT